jgi:hypothetical protein
MDASTGPDSLAFAPAPREPEPGRARELSPAYLALVARVEARAENQDGADKSWVHRFLAWADTHHSRARPR